MSRTILLNHPGAEPAANSITDGHCAWNVSDRHRRKYLIAPVRFAIPVGSAHRYMLRDPHEATFWGEWEPPSEAAPLAASEAGSPKFCHRPVLELPAPPRSQNTDPWVFGDTMRYSICRQAAAPVLRELDPGDLVLFGSVQKNEEEWDFLLDTVFVIDERHPYAGEQRADVPPQAGVDELYLEAVLKRRNPSFAGQSIYNGRMLSGASDGPFSWVPSMPAFEGAPRAFSRPKINQLFDTHFPNPQGVIKELPIPADEAWTKVTDHVRSLGLWLGARVALPPVSSSNGSP
jgi:hypothetical protein